MSAPSDLTDPVNVERLTPWLDQNIPELGAGRLVVKLISGGSTNIVASLDRGGKKVVLRRAPPAAAPQSAKTIEREATVLKALNGTDVPHPHLYAYCADPAVIGAGFYVMDLVDGWASEITETDTRYPARFSQGPDQHYIGYAMIDGLIKMAKLDYKAAGLEKFGRPDGFLERQVDRWLGQLASYPVTYKKYSKRDIPGLDYVADWLRANTPKASVPGLMHGDYATNNVLFAHHPPTRLVAIIDWETATIGDPLMDLAGFALQLHDAVNPANNSVNSYFDPANFPSRQDVLRYYAAETGRDLSQIDYYMILYRFRMACMIEYKVAEAAEGLSPKAKGERFDRMVRNLIAEAKDTAQRLG